MIRTNLFSRSKFRRRVSVGLVSIATAMAGCNSSSLKEKIAEKAAARSAAAAPANTAANPNSAASLQDLSGTSECDLAMIRHAPAPFHLSFKKSTPTENDTWEADITPTSIDGSSNINGRTAPIHADSSDQHSMDMQGTMFIMPMPFLDFNMAKSGGTFPIGADPVNGYDTIKYVVDTRKMDQHEKAGWLAGMGAKDFNIAATGWVTRDTGCLVKFNADFEVDNKDGSTDKTHWEGDFIRKQ